MKQIILSILCVALIGCTSTKQQAAFNSISSVEQTSTAAYQGYISLVIQGKIPTNDVPKVSHLFNDVQASVNLASLAVQFNTNAVAPANLVTEAGALLNLITTIEGGK